MSLCPDIRGYFTRLSWLLFCISESFFLRLFYRPGPIERFCGKGFFAHWVLRGDFLDPELSGLVFINGEEYSYEKRAEDFRQTRKPKKIPASFLCITGSASCH